MGGIDLPSWLLPVSPVALLAVPPFPVFLLPPWAWLSSFLT